MAKKLKLWNGRGWGRQNYEGPLKHHHVYPGAASRIYICAHSRAHAARIMAEHLPRYSGFNGEVSAATHELKTYASEGSWGTDMKGIEPEVGIWVAVGRESHPDIKCIWKESDE